MKNRRAIAFFLFWSAVFALALVLLSNSGRLDSAPAGGCLSGIDVREVVRMDIERRTGDGSGIEKVSVARVNGRWRMESPVVAEAEEEVVKRLIDAVVFSEPVHRLSESDMAALGRSLRDFGLSAPLCTVTVSSGDVRETFSVGRKTADGNEVYACKTGSKGVFTVSARLSDELSRPLVEFRRRRLFMFRPSDVVGIGLKNAGEPLTRLAKSGGQWRIADPVDAPADIQAVEDLITDLCSENVVDYVADAGLGFGLGEGEGFAISLRDAFGIVERVVFGVADGTNAVWALTSEGAVVHVRRDLFERCMDRRKMLEDTRIFPVDPALVTSLSLSEGFPAYVVARQSPSAPWMMVSPVDALADAKVVEGILSNVLSVRGVELTEEGGAGSLAVSLGTSVTNFSARHVFGGMLMQDARLEDLLGKTMIRCCRERIRRIAVKTSAGDAWNAALSEEVVSLLDSGISAERVEAIVLKPADFERCGFSRPAYTISFELDDDVSSMRRMLIGAAAPEGGRFAAIGGLDAAFVLSPSVISILAKPVEASMEKKR